MHQHQFICSSNMFFFTEHVEEKKEVFKRLLQKQLMYHNFTPYLRYWPSQSQYWSGS